MLTKKFMRMIRDYPWLWATGANDPRAITWNVSQTEITARVLKVSDLKARMWSNRNESDPTIWIYFKYDEGCESIEQVTESAVWQRADQKSLADRIAWQIGGERLDHQHTITCLAVREDRLNTSITILRAPLGISINEMVRANRTPKADWKN